MEAGVGESWATLWWILFWRVGLRMGLEGWGFGWKLTELGEVKEEVCEVGIELSDSEKRGRNTQEYCYSGGGL